MASPKVFVAEDHPAAVEAPVIKPQATPAPVWIAML